MAKLARVFLACVVASAFVAAPAAVYARTKDKPNSGFCKSGKRAADVKDCKENGGTR